MSFRILTVCCWLLAYSSATSAIPFGAFDPRSLAMGGAGVASGTSANAAYYNPALLAMFKTRKELGNNSSFIFPASTLRYADATEIIKDVEDKHLDQDLVDAINAFNIDTTAQNARAVLEAAQDLDSNLDELLDGPVFLDGNVGMVLGIGHKYEGGSIIINRRVVADGVIENFESDLLLLADYVDAMQFIEDGGDPTTAATLYPNIFTADGRIIDQTDNLTSEAVGSGVDVVEIGMAMSMQFEVFGRNIGFGITPKVLQVDIYDFTADATTGNITKVHDTNDNWDVNLDFGVAHDLDNHWRLGMVIKNLRTLKYTTSLDNEIQIKPQLRAGVMYNTPYWGLYTIDVDVIENQPLSKNSKTQMLAAGGEWRVLKNWKLRAGYSMNLKGKDNGKKGLFTWGAHWDFYNGLMDLTYAENSYERAAGVQMGYRF